MADADALLARARRAFRSGEWESARDAFQAAREQLASDGLDLPPAHLRELADCEWWLGRIDPSLRALEAALRGATADAAASAELTLRIAEIRFLRGEMTLGTAWMRRAERLLAQLPEGRDHAYLVYLVAGLALDGTGEQWSARSVERLRALEESVDDPAVHALSAVVSGMRLVRAGDVAEGFSRLDDAMLHVVAGDVDPVWAGDILCATIHACDEVADYRRMADWIRAAEEWCASQGAPAVYVGVCRIHRLDLRSAGGEWPTVESELESVCAEVTETDTWTAGYGWYRLGELRRLRGDREGARRAYARARECAIDPMPGEALLAVDEGAPARAWARLQTALPTRDDMARARLLRPGIEIALRNDRVDAARELLSDLEDAADRYGSEGFRAWADEGRGMIEAAAGDPRSAPVHLNAALDGYRRLRMRWDQAHALVWLAAAYDRDGQSDHASEARTLAEGILADLGAVMPPQPPVTGGPQLLTPRECEVVEHVARGHSNREIAQALSISEKTVGRHLANVYIKLGVSSRTAAAAWWRDRDSASQ